MEPNTNLASEFFVLSQLHRLGLSAVLTVANAKKVDIIVFGSKGFITLDVKGMAGSTQWRIAFTKIVLKGMYVFVAYRGKIGALDTIPDVYFMKGQQLVYHGRRRQENITITLRTLDALKKKITNKNRWERIIALVTRKHGHGQHAT